VAQNSLRSYMHNIHSISSMKVATCSVDTKRYTLSDGITSLAHGHCRIAKN
jgi:hypothetical protein